MEADLSEYASSPPSTKSSIDEDEVNRRVRPCWNRYRRLLESKGFHLETFRDVKSFYECVPDYQMPAAPGHMPIHTRMDEDALCPDPGLPDNLFRGYRTCDGRRVMVKAVHVDSRELDIIRYLSTPPRRMDPMNHCIPVLDLIEVRDDCLAFLVMEEWSSQLVSVTPCCLRLFLAALQQCIEHAVFMHKHRIAHLDISIRNLLTDYNGHYAYIDFELSRRFNGDPNPRVQGYRGTEIPPEVERGEPSDPYKIDVWAMGVLILRACKLTGFFVPQIMNLVEPMLCEEPDSRPCMEKVLRMFDIIVRSIDPTQLQSSCPSQR
ncbi:non-specific serine/threonine protein kinase [Pleurotus pulmonarius]|nr:hypothetical protein EYR36_004569 [Pleurotus pulmonarius]KAF4579001.1 hypothetical protein EYR36_000810 [Pleurotus pulmonarius]KAF4603667.1 hypothetical protein EYR38_004082 [Pleurotus pulmonarius]